jgi:alpha-1,2-mannosyltransferase
LSLAFFRDAAWLSKQRLWCYPAISIAASIAVVIWVLSGHGVNDPAGRLVGTDFISFWTVSWSLLHGHARDVYAPEALARLEQTVVLREDTAFYAWQYPPTALLIVYFLGMLPYLWSLAIWLLTGLTGYLTALWRISAHPLALWVGSAFPAVLLTVVHGQNALLTTSLLAWALILLNERPILAGILVGLLSFKPHLALLLPIALLAGRHWRTVAAAALTVFGLSVAAILLFDSAVWSDFFASIGLSHQILDSGLVPYYKMQSVFAALRLLGAPLPLAYSGQALVAAAAAVVVAWVWRRRGDSEIKSAALVSAIPLATPFFLDYDLMIIAPAIAWLALRSIQHGPLPWERTALVASFMVPLISRGTAEYTHILVTPIVAGGLLAAAVGRIRAGRGIHNDGKLEPLSGEWVVNSIKQPQPFTLNTTNK